MVIIPKERPVIENLNSYYIDIHKLIEHYQGALGSGAIHFHASSAEGVIFFDKDELLGGTYSDKQGETNGKEAIDRLVEGAAQISYCIGIYGLDPEKVYFWANLSAAEPIYKDLSTEFTDLNGLIRKMASQGLTGYIQVSTNAGNEGGLIFLMDGEIIGGSYSWRPGEVDGSKENQSLLIQKSKESGGTFHVGRISPSRIAPIKTDAPADLPVHQPAPSNALLTALEEMLVIFERTISSNRKIKAGFGTLMKKKFVELADRYSFLDPFAGEFEYTNQKITYRGDATHQQLAQAVIESVRSLSEDLGIKADVKQSLDPWLKKYADGLAGVHVGF